MASIFVVGGGAREHALAFSLHLHGHHVEAAPGNAGLEALGKCYPGVSATDIDALAALAATGRYDLVVPGSEETLARGLADRLAEVGIACFGPTAKAARLETSKVFAKVAMNQAGVPTADYRFYGSDMFGTYAGALADIERAEYPLVVKDDGLALGKGVTICRSEATARTAIEALMAAKKTFLIEQFFEGVECSVMVATDGIHYINLPVTQDYKRVGEHDTGPMTGGMGAVTPIAACDAAMMARIERDIIQPVLRELQRRGIVYRGCLYFAIMITTGGPAVLEINARFGDPETEVAFAMLEEDPFPWLYGAATGTLTETRAAKVYDGACAAVVACSGGYPDAYEKGKIILGWDEPLAPDTWRIAAGMQRTSEGLVTSGGRVMAGVARRCNMGVGSGLALAVAIEGAYSALRPIQFDGMYFRREIGCNSHKLP